MWERQTPNILAAELCDVLGIDREKVLGRKEPEGVHLTAT